MRLDKFVSHATALSRSASRRAIKSAAVRLNDELVSNPQLEVGEADQVELDGATLALPGARYLMLHKPAGYVCATADSENPIVMDLLEDLAPEKQRGLSIVGRLDKDTTGLLLLSDDGQWIHRLTSPRHNHPKTYVATLERAVNDEDVRAFAQGLKLKSETQPTRAADLKPLPDKRAQITITEGRYHQVKRMFAATGNRVLALHRQQVGQIILDDELSPGEYRPLTATEIASVAWTIPAIHNCLSS